MPASSSSTTEPQVAGFRIGREIARGVFEAVQIELERPVTLQLLGPGDHRFRAGAWPEHPRVATLYAAGERDGGFYVATRRVPGATTLRRRSEAGADPARWIADVRAALAETGAVHGNLGDESALLVDRDGQVVITGFGLAPPDATAAGDEAVLAGLVRTAGRPRCRRAAVAVLVAVVAAIVIAVALGRGGDAPVRSADCEGQVPSGSSPACTLVLGGAVARDGVVRAWHVRGAKGEVALRVIRPRSGGAYAVTARSDFESVDGGPRSFRVSVPVRRGDRLGLELSPGSAAGFRPGKATTRFVGPLGAEPRRPEPRGPAEALRLRVDLTPGAAVQPELVTGAAAAGAPDGRRLEERELAVAGGTTVTATVVVLPGGVAVDVFRSATRQARISVPRADPAGRPVSFTAKGAADLTLAWRNPDGTLVETPYRVTATSIAAL